MRILIVTSWATDVIGGSGTAVFFNSFVEGLRAAHHEIEIIAPNYDTTDYVEVTLRRFLFNADLRTDPRIGRADVVIGFDYDGYALDPETRPPFIVSAHAVYGDLISWESGPVQTMVHAQAFFDQIAMQRADWVTAGSHYAKGQIIRRYGIPPEKIQVIHHGQALPAWMPLVASEPRAENARPTVLAVGKLYPRKRIEVLLRAIPILRERCPTVEVRIVGNGLEWEKLHALVDSLNIQPHVTWLSHLSDDRQFAKEWRQADVFCHPSVQETFGYVYLEAMRLGKAIVANTASTGPEVIGEAGLLVEPENPDALATGIATLLENPQLRAQYGERARQRAARFTLEAMLQGYSEALETACRLHSQNGKSLGR